MIHDNGKVIAEIMVVQGSEEQLRLGITATKAIGVDRAEVFERNHPNALAAHKKLPK